MTHAAATRQDPATGLRWWQGVASPGVGGYLLAVVVSAAAVGLGAGASMVPDAFSGREDPGSLLTGSLLVGVVALLFAVPLAPAGVLLVHLACLRVRHQAVHVLAAGVAGAVTALVWGWVVDTGEVGGFALGLGAATACGRAAVAPLARRRQAARQPVDDDSREGAARC